MFFSEKMPLCSDLRCVPLPSSCAGVWIASVMRGNKEQQAGAAQHKHTGESI